tara:strand:- start:6617 stop:7015 length:399 start_codon:yes stop_codon:yes gene_type:complete
MLWTTIVGMLAHFDNLSILSRLKNGEYRAEEAESKAGSSQGNSAGAGKESANAKQTTETSGERPPPEITKTTDSGIALFSLDDNASIAESTTAITEQDASRVINGITRDWVSGKDRISLARALTFLPNEIKA